MPATGHHLDLHPISTKHVLLISDIGFSLNNTLNIHFNIAFASLSLFKSTPSCFSFNHFISSIFHSPKPSTHTHVILHHFQIITYMLVPCTIFFTTILFHPSLQTTYLHPNLVAAYLTKYQKPNTHFAYTVLSPILLNPPFRSAFTVTHRYLFYFILHNGILNFI